MRLITLAFLFGIILSHVFPHLPIHFSLVFGLIVVSFKYPYCRYFLAICIGYLWSIWHLNSILAQTLATEIEWQEVIVTGCIVDLPQKLDDKWQFYFIPEQLQFQDKQYDFIGKIKLSWYKNTRELRPGQRWRFTVRLKKPHVSSNFGLRDQSTTLLVKRIKAIGYIRNPASAQLLQQPSIWHIDNWRYRLSSAIYQTLPHNEITGLLVALAVGHQPAISPPQYKILQYTGTAHLMAISGLHIGLIIMVSLFVFKVMRKLRLYPSYLALRIPAPQSAAIFALISALIYSLLAGFSVPTQRAFIIIAVFAITILLKRKIATSYTLSLALLFVLIWDPLSVQTQGFWLSFGAFSIIGYIFSGRRAVLPSRETQLIFKYFSFIKSKKQFLDEVFFPLEPYHFKKIPDCALVKRYFLNYNRLQPQQPIVNFFKLGNLLLCSLCFSLFFKLKNWVKVFNQMQVAIILMLFPSLLMIFGYISLTTFFANAIAIPTVSLIVIPFVLLGTLFILPLPTIATFMFTIASYIMEKLWIYLAWLAQYGVWEWAKPSWLSIFIATIGVLILLLPSGFPNKLLGIIWLCPLFFINHPPAIQTGELQFTLLDVGQGLAAAIRTRNHVILYDTGIKVNENFDSGKRVIIPFLKAQRIEKIDHLIVSHSDIDHSGGLKSIVAMMPVTEIFTNNPKELNHILPNYPIKSCQAGQHWEIDGVNFDMLHPSQVYIPKDNNRSCVLKISIGQYAILLPGDIEQLVEAQLNKLQAAQLQANVLIVPHHGSLTSSTEAFIEAVNPEIALFSVGYRNMFGFPKPEVVSRYKKRQIFTLMTAETGAIQFKMNELGILQLHFAKPQPDF